MPASTDLDLNSGRRVFSPSHQQALWPHSRPEYQGNLYSLGDFDPGVTHTEASCTAVYFFRLKKNHWGGTDGSALSLVAKPENKTTPESTSTSKNPSYGTADINNEVSERSLKK